MIEGRVSETALQVAAARAAHLRFDPAPHLLEDRQAEALLGPERLAELLPLYADESGIWITIENRVFLPLRARFAEDRVAAAHSDGVLQLVQLGAGLDSFAFRRPEAMASLRVFEVDHPSTQRWKQERVEALGWSWPANTECVACDFERQRLSEALAASSFDRTAPACVVWMGVTYYLTPNAVRDALVELRTLLAPGSRLLLDTMVPAEDMPERYRALQAEMSRWLAGRGEPQQTRYRDEAIRALLAECGFSDVLVSGPREIEREYLAARGDALPLSERFRLVAARV